MKARGMKNRSDSNHGEARRRGPNSTPQTKTCPRGPGYLCSAQDDRVTETALLIALEFVKGGLHKFAADEVEGLLRCPLADSVAASAEGALEGISLLGV